VGQTLSVLIETHMVYPGGSEGAQLIRSDELVLVSGKKDLIALTLRLAYQRDIFGFSPVQIDNVRNIVLPAQDS